MKRAASVSVPVEDALTREDAERLVRAELPLDGLDVLYHFEAEQVVHEFVIVDLLGVTEWLPFAPSASFINNRLLLEPGLMEKLRGFAEGSEYLCENGVPA